MIFDTFSKLSTPPLVFVWLGDRFPEWMKSALLMNQHLSAVDTILISNSAAGHVLGFKHQIFLEDFYLSPAALNVRLAEQNPRFRNGFWGKTTERFFVLKQFMDKFSVSACFHAEIDNLIFDISKLSTSIDKIGRGFFCPRDAINRGIASLVYVNEKEALNALLSLAADKSHSLDNDMYLLGHLLQTSATFYSLPTENLFAERECTSWTPVDSALLAGIFDAAAIGQFLFGIDPRNTGPLLFNRFENENCGYDLKALTYEINVPKKSFAVIRKTDGLRVNLYNLHIHSKLFKQLSDPNRLAQILNRTNNGRKTLMILNLHNNILFKKIAAVWHKLLRIVAI
ncbi:MAG: hypothetical protein NBV66_00655 [Burkholderiaceae bacterium]|nr:hypothetical protein [Burkholderiaceae bacterium]